MSYNDYSKMLDAQLASKYPGRTARLSAQKAEAKRLADQKAVYQQEYLSPAYDRRLDAEKF